MKPQKIIAITLATLMFVMDCVCVHAAETNFWKERRKSLQIAALPSQHPTGFNFSNLNQLPPLKTQELFADHKWGQMPAFVQSVLKHLPYSYGTVRDIHHPKSGPSGKIIVMVQDIHMNQEAQTNISNAVANLSKSLPVDFVALEGTSGAIDLAQYRKSTRADILGSVADFLLKTNRISGSVHAGLTMTSQPPRFFGVEQPALYNFNVKSYREAAPLMPKVQKHMKAAESQLLETGKKFSNPALLSFDTLVRRYHRHEIQMGAYVMGLSGYAKLSPELARFQQAIRIEESLDFKRVESERAALIENLSAKLDRDELATLYQRGLAFRQSSLSPHAFYRHLSELIQRKNMSLRHYPAVKQYIDYVLAAEGINGESIFHEMTALENEIYRKLARSAEEEKFVEQLKLNRATQKLLSFSLTSNEWNEYQQLVLSTKYSVLSTDLKPFEAFYLAARYRNDAITDRLLAQMEKKSSTTGVLVAGGFHATDITALLNNAGFTVISFTPKITKVDMSSGSEYLSVFTQEKTPLEKLVLGEKLFLASIPQEGNLLIPPLARGEEIALAQGVTRVDGLTESTPQGTVEYGIEMKPSVIPGKAGTLESYTSKPVRSINAHELGSLFIAIPLLFIVAFPLASSGLAVLLPASQVGLLATLGFWLSFIGSVVLVVVFVYKTARLILGAERSQKFVAEAKAWVRAYENLTILIGTGIAGENIAGKAIAGILRLPLSAVKSFYSFGFKLVSRLHDIQEGKTLEKTNWIENSFARAPPLAQTYLFWGYAAISIMWERLRMFALSRASRWILTSLIFIAVYLIGSAAGADAKTQILWANSVLNFNLLNLINGAEWAQQFSPDTFTGALVQLFSGTYYLSKYFLRLIQLVIADLTNKNGPKISFRWLGWTLVRSLAVGWDNYLINAEVAGITGLGHELGVGAAVDVVEVKMLGAADDLISHAGADLDGVIKLHGLNENEVRSVTAKKMEPVSIAVAPVPAPEKTTETPETSEQFVGFGGKFGPILNALLPATFGQVDPSQTADTELSKTDGLQDQLNELKEESEKVNADRTRLQKSIEQAKKHPVAMPADRTPADKLGWKALDDHWKTIRAADQPNVIGVLYDPTTGKFARPFLTEIHVPHIELVKSLSAEQKAQFQRGIQGLTDDHKVYTIRDKQAGDKTYVVYPTIKFDNVYTQIPVWEAELQKTTERSAELTANIAKLETDIRIAQEKKQTLEQEQMQSRELELAKQKEELEAKAASKESRKAPENYSVEESAIDELIDEGDEHIQSLRDRIAELDRQITTVRTTKETLASLTALQNSIAQMEKTLPILSSEKIRGASKNDSYLNELHQRYLRQGFKPTAYLRDENGRWNDMLNESDRKYVRNGKLQDGFVFGGNGPVYEVHSVDTLINKKGTALIAMREEARQLEEKLAAVRSLDEAKAAQAGVTKLSNELKDLRKENSSSKIKQVSHQKPTRQHAVLINSRTGAETPLPSRPEGKFLTVSNLSRADRVDFGGIIEKWNLSPNDEIYEVYEAQGSTDRLGRNHSGGQWRGKAIYLVDRPRSTPNSSDVKPARSDEAPQAKDETENDLELLKLQHEKQELTAHLAESISRQEDLREEGRRISRLTEIALLTQNETSAEQESNVNAENREPEEEDFEADDWDAVETKVVQPVPTVRQLPQTAAAKPADVQKSVPLWNKVINVSIVLAILAMLWGAVKGSYYWWTQEKEPVTNFGEIFKQRQLKEEAAKQKLLEEQPKTTPAEKSVLEGKTMKPTGRVLYYTNEEGTRQLDRSIYESEDETVQQQFKHRYFKDGARKGLHRRTTFTQTNITKLTSIEGTYYKGEVTNESHDYTYDAENRITGYLERGESSLKGYFIPGDEENKPLQVDIRAVEDAKLLASSRIEYVGDSRARIYVFFYDPNRSSIAERMDRGDNADRVVEFNIGKRPVDLYRHLFNGSKVNVRGKDNTMMALYTTEQDSPSGERVRMLEINDMQATAPEMQGLRRIPTLKAAALVTDSLPGAEVQNWRRVEMYRRRRVALGANGDKTYISPDVLITEGKKPDYERSGPPAVDPRNPEATFFQEIVDRRFNLDGSVRTESRQTYSISEEESAPSAQVSWDLVKLPQMPIPVKTPLKVVPQPSPDASAEPEPQPARKASSATDENNRRTGLAHALVLVVMVLFLVILFLGLAPFTRLHVLPPLPDKPAISTPAPPNSNAHRHRRPPYSVAVAEETALYNKQLTTNEWIQLHNPNLLHFYGLKSLRITISILQSFVKLWLSLTSWIIDIQVQQKLLDVAIQSHLFYNQFPLLGALFGFAEIKGLEEGVAQLSRVEGKGVHSYQDFNDLSNEMHRVNNRFNDYGFTWDKSYRKRRQHFPRGTPIMNVYFDTPLYTLTGAREVSQYNQFRFQMRARTRSRNPDVIFFEIKYLFPNDGRAKLRVAIKRELAWKVAKGEPVDPNALALPPDHKDYQMHYFAYQQWVNTFHLVQAKTGHKPEPRIVTMYLRQAIEPKYIPKGQSPDFRFSWDHHAMWSMVTEEERQKLFNPRLNFWLNPDKLQFGRHTLYYDTYFPGRPLTQSEKKWAGRVRPQRMQQLIREFNWIETPTSKVTDSVNQLAGLIYEQGVHIPLWMGIAIPPWVHTSIFHGGIRYEDYIKRHNSAVWPADLEEDKSPIEDDPDRYESPTQEEAHITGLIAPAIIEKALPIIKTVAVMLAIGIVLIGFDGVASANEVLAQVDALGALPADTWEGTTVLDAIGADWKTSGIPGSRARLPWAVSEQSLWLAMLNGFLIMFIHDLTPSTKNHEQGFWLSVIKESALMALMVMVLQNAVVLGIILGGVTFYRFRFGERDRRSMLTMQFASICGLAAGLQLGWWTLAVNFLIQTLPIALKLGGKLDGDARRFYLTIEYTDPERTEALLKLLFSKRAHNYAIPFPDEIEDGKWRSTWEFELKKPRQMAAFKKMIERINDKPVKEGKEKVIHIKTFQDLTRSPRVVTVGGLLTPFLFYLALNRNGQGLQAAEAGASVTTKMSSFLALDPSTIYLIGGLFTLIFTIWLIKQIVNAFSSGGEDLSQGVGDAEEQALIKELGQKERYSFFEGLRLLAKKVVIPLYVAGIFTRATYLETTVVIPASFAKVLSDRGTITTLTGGELIKVGVPYNAYVVKDKTIVAVVRPMSEGTLRDSIAMIVSKTQIALDDNAIELVKYRQAVGQNNRNLATVAYDIATEKALLATEKAELEAAKEIFERMVLPLYRQGSMSKTEFIEARKQTRIFEPVVSVREEGIKKLEEELAKLQKIQDADEVQASAIFLRKSNTLLTALAQEIKAFRSTNGPKIHTAHLTGWVKSVPLVQGEMMPPNTIIMEIQSQAPNVIVGYADAMGHRPVMGERVLVKQLRLGGKVTQFESTIVSVGPRREAINQDVMESAYAQAVLANRRRRADSLATEGIPYIVQIPPGINLLPGETLSISFPDVDPQEFINAYQEPLEPTSPGIQLEINDDQEKADAVLIDSLKENHIDNLMPSETKPGAEKGEFEPDEEEVEKQPLEGTLGGRNVYHAAKGEIPFAGRSAGITYNETHKAHYVINDKGELHPFRLDADFKVDKRFKKIQTGSLSQSLLKGVVSIKRDTFALLFENEILVLDIPRGVTEPKREDAPLIISLPAGTKAERIDYNPQDGHLYVRSKNPNDEKTLHFSKVALDGKNRGIALPIKPFSNFDHVIDISFLPAAEGAPYILVLTKGNPEKNEPARLRTIRNGLVDSVKLEGIGLTELDGAKITVQDNLIFILSNNGKTHTVLRMDPVKKPNQNSSSLQPKKNPFQTLTAKIDYGTRMQASAAKEKMGFRPGGKVNAVLGREVASLGVGQIHTKRGPRSVHLYSLMSVVAFILLAPITIWLPVLLGSIFIGAIVLAVGLLTRIFRIKLLARALRRLPDNQPLLIPVTKETLTQNLAHIRELKLALATDDALRERFRGNILVTMFNLDAATASLVWKETDEFTVMESRASASNGVYAINEQLFAEAAGLIIDTQSNLYQTVEAFANHRINRHRLAILAGDAKLFATSDNFTDHLDWVSLMAGFWTVSEDNSLTKRFLGLIASASNA